MGIKNNKKIAFLLVLLITILSGCNPQHYTHEERNEMTQEGQKQVDEWAAVNMPDAVFTVNDVLLEGHEGDWGLSDAATGTYVNGSEEGEFIYVWGTGNMYTDKLYDAATKMTEEMYAEGLGIEYTEVSYTNKLRFKIHATAYRDKGGIGDVEKADTVLSCHCLPYDLDEADLENYLKGYFSEYKGDRSEAGPYYITTSEKIDETSVDMSFMKEYPGVNLICISNADKTETIAYSIDGEHINTRFINSWMDASFSDAVKGMNENSVEYTQQRNKHYHKETIRERTYDINTLEILEEK